jgi:hypothetical protein
MLEAELAQLFQSAMAKEAHGDLIKHGGVSSSLDYLRSVAREHDYKLVLFLYSGHFDPEVARELVNVDKPYREGDPTPREIFEHKVSRIPVVFEPFVLMTDTLAGYYVAALMQGHHGAGLPLIWDVPVHDQATTGYSSFALWWTTFQYLCEIAAAIFTYGGFSREYRNEQNYVFSKPHLVRRLLWLDQDLRTYFPDDETVTWSATDVAKAIEAAKRRSAA